MDVQSQHMLAFSILDINCSGFLEYVVRFIKWIAHISTGTSSVNPLNAPIHDSMRTGDGYYFLGSLSGVVILALLDNNRKGCNPVLLIDDIVCMGDYQPAILTCLICRSVRY